MTAPEGERERRWLWRSLAKECAWRSLAKNGARRAEVRAIQSGPLIDYSLASWAEWDTLQATADAIGEMRPSDD